MNESWKEHENKKNVTEDFKQKPKLSQRQKYLQGW